MIQQDMTLGDLLVLVARAIKEHGTDSEIKLYDENGKLMTGSLYFAPTKDD